jgi:hypothetical protein
MNFGLTSRFQEIALLAFKIMSVTIAAAAIGAVVIMLF